VTTAVLGVDEDPDEVDHNGLDQGTGRSPGVCRLLRIA